MARLPARDDFEWAVYGATSEDVGLNDGDKARLRGLVAEFHKRRRQFYEDREHADWTAQGMDGRVERLQAQLDQSIEALIGKPAFTAFRAAMIPAQRRIVRQRRQAGNSAIPSRF